MCQPWDQHALYMLYNIIVFKYSTMFYYTSCDFVIITVTISSDVTDVWQYDCDITSNLNPRSQKSKNKVKEKKNGY